MAEHNELGKLGEEMAVEFLEKTGYEILETNWVFQKAEVDIIARKDKIVAIVEVKTRRSVEFGTALEAVTPGKAARLRKLAAAWLASQDGSFEQIRIDVMGVTLPKSGPATVDHVRGIA